jgi:hypothetical protein
LSNEKEKQFYNVVHVLWHVREVALKELYFLKKIDYGMFQQKKNLEYPVYFYQSHLGEVLILDEFVDVAVKDKKILR